MSVEECKTILDIITVDDIGDVLSETFTTMLGFSSGTNSILTLSVHGVQVGKVCESLTGL